MMMGVNSSNEPALQWEDSDNEGEGGSNSTSLQKQSGNGGGKSFGKRSAKQIWLIPGKIIFKGCRLFLSANCFLRVVAG